MQGAGNSTRERGVDPRLPCWPCTTGTTAPFVLPPGRVPASNNSRPRAARPTEHRRRVAESQSRRVLTCLVSLAVTVSSIAPAPRAPVCLPRTLSSAHHTDTCRRPKVVVSFSQSSNCPSFLFHLNNHTLTSPTTPHRTRTTIAKRRSLPRSHTRQRALIK